MSFVSNRITADRLHKKLGNQPLIIDVRSTSAFAMGHVSGSINVPLQDIQQSSSQLELNQEAAVHLVCTDASHSDVAAGILRDSGFKDVLVLAGGLKSWSALGFPLHRMET